MSPAELKLWTHEELENAILEAEYGPLTDPQPKAVVPGIGAVYWNEEA